MKDRMLGLTGLLLSSAWACLHVTLKDYEVEQWNKQFFEITDNGKYFGKCYTEYLTDDKKCCTEFNHCVRYDIQKSSMDRKHFYYIRDNSTFDLTWIGPPYEIFPQGLTIGRFYSMYFFC
ncbi:hypothetical protein DSO57_1000345 [Entomophthora muscae]|uniref:Uncharacterized protein n=1 Tax=Entomophthora muscae TaxID=34485 RepID=A0ACC2TKI7_9FUNG|nr:hypothetical protein DSO57_1000345 [Entomophthora muscae]